ncbi:GerAB/ArcD/ProY family transporter, partial [Paenibacillus ihuae]|uniref:GerAB/ArcD/ProY family transporter n=1 Tax=Paenibacillus ihuae TaxID=1232431 RepID=UPI00131DE99F
PLFILSMLMILSGAYVLHKGLEVLTRTSLMFAVIVLLIGVFSLVLLILSGSIKLLRLLPVLENGIGPVMDSVVHQNYMFPFGEMICFTMLMPYLSGVKKDRGLLRQVC